MGRKTRSPSRTGDEERFRFPPEERKVVTQSYDLSVLTLVEQWDTELLILPEIQREYVWDNARASRLVESLMLNIPIPVIYLAETEDAKYEIIDGHQRVRSIVRFVKNEFALTSLNVLDEYRRHRFHELPNREQRFLTMRAVRAVVITQDSHPSMKFEIFERLNSGTITLNAQELRNSMYRGPFNNLLKELVLHETLRAMIGTTRPRRRMVDEELLLRFFALGSKFDGYKPPLKRFLNDYMRSVRNASAQELRHLEGIFKKTIGRLDIVLGSGAFRLTDENGHPVEKTVNRALFDAQMLVFSWVDERELRVKRPAALRALAKEYRSAGFLDTIQRATGDRARTRRRVRLLASALDAAGLSVSTRFELEKD